jgi:SAM-dependent methyltransferase
MDPLPPEDASSLSETDRILAENRRRAAKIPAGRYAPWQPAEMLMCAERKRLAAAMLHRAGAFPGAETPCLEVGCGNLGWLGDLITWGVEERRLAGIELDGERARRARASLPAADLRQGDAASLPWGESELGLVIVSTVMTSVLDSGVRRRMADEIVRVLRPGGALVWYDFRFDNPRNPAVRGIGRRQLRALFPGLGGEIRSLTLAPPLARLIAPRSYPAAVLLSGLPFLRTHLLAVLTR